MSTNTAASARSVGEAIVVGQPLKASMQLADVAALLDVTLHWAYKLQAGGCLRAFELPPIGHSSRKRYSGKKFQTWLDSDAQQRVSFVPSASTARKGYSR